MVRRSLGDLKIMFTSMRYKASTEGLWNKSLLKSDSLT